MAKKTISVALPQGMINFLDDEIKKFEKENYLKVSRSLCLEKYIWDDMRKKGVLEKFSIDSTPLSDSMLDRREAQIKNDLEAQIKKRGSYNQLEDFSDKIFHAIVEETGYEKIKKDGKEKIVRYFSGVKMMDPKKKFGFEYGFDFNFQIETL